MTNPTTILIGGGNMGGAMAQRWHATKKGSVGVVEHNNERRGELTKLGIPTYAKLTDAPDAATYILAIKPQQFSENLGAFKKAIPSDALLISIMAGTPLAQLRVISKNAVRIMPNLPATIGESMSVACAPKLNKLHTNTVNKLFDAIGALAWVEDEEMLHAVTGISGSGPAYVFAFMEALEQAAAKAGLDPELAAHLVAQTLRGAALLAEQSTLDVRTLREQVTSKGGTTEAALASFTKSGLDKTVKSAVDACIDRSKQLSKNV